ncbi:MAG TPA: peptidoglycan editing factor PgeF [Aestuariivirgaceae bacterium]|jgi:hypothetical protein
MIQAPALQQIAKVKHGFFTREGGYSKGLFASLNCGYGSGDDRQTVALNRDLVAARLHVKPDDLLTAYQQHSPTVISVAQSWSPQAAPRADAMVTRQSGIALAALTADCAPVLFAASTGEVVGIAHAGWKGALAGVAEATLSAMESLGVDRRNVVAAIGPTISGAAYEVGTEFHHRFLESDPANSAFFKLGATAGHYMFDLPAYLAARLRRSGLKTIVDLALCTYSDEQRFFSYRRATHRREQQYGRLISAIAIAP